MITLRAASAVFARELSGYFATPLAYVFLVIFLFAMGAFTFYLGGFYESEQASLEIFFSFHPWLYLFLIPAIAMRLWAEERKSGTIELLLTLPIPLGAAVAGKFFAAWVFAGIALVLTFPVWLTVNYLGEPDNGVILASYLGSWAMAGGYLAIGSAVSAGTSNQVIAFVVSVVICFLFTVAGTPLVVGFFAGLGVPLAILNTISSFSFLFHFNAIMTGVIDLRDLIFFGTLIGFFLFVTAILVDLRRAG
jgi:ABC-2 type transport system permease protein